MCAYTTIMPLSACTLLQPNDKPSNITSDNASSRIYLKIPSLGLVFIKRIQVSRSLMAELSILVLILDLTSPRRVSFTVVLALEWRPLYIYIYIIYIYISILWSS